MHGWSMTTMKRGVLCLEGGLHFVIALVYNVLPYFLITFAVKETISIKREPAWYQL